MAKDTDQTSRAQDHIEAIALYDNLAGPPLMRR